ncbi:MAG: PEP-CTERM sorting domain-containing protein [Planctomycetales bacterium]|nr:PEP-CTERM sorting domain-containing protein [Planctomycetales bacterium]
MIKTTVDISNTSPRTEGDAPERPIGERDAVRRAAYALAAGAFAAAGADRADAAIVYSGSLDWEIFQGNALPVNLDGDAYDDILLKNYVFGGGNYQGLSVNFFPGKIVGFTAGFNYVTALSGGEMIDFAATSSGSFAASLAYGAANPNAEFNAGEAIIGLEFPINATSHFGWLRVTIDNAAGTFVVNDYAYQDVPGEGLRAGQIPEPGALGLLAAGSAGLAALRRRKS